MSMLGRTNMAKCVLQSILSKSCYLSRVYRVSSNSKFVIRNIHRTPAVRGLEEFFDDEENWGLSTVNVGRPWRKDELRLKSNEDLHKLWYILLKERNMVMTMQREYMENRTVFPAPERIEKVEESMENLLDVVAERDKAVNLLETGETGEPGKRWIVNELGRGVWRRNTEHEVPLHEHPELKDTDKPRKTKWAVAYKRLYREEMENRELEKKAALKQHEKEVRAKLPDDEYYSG